MLSFANYSCVLNETGEKRVRFLKPNPWRKTAFLSFDGAGYEGSEVRLYSSFVN